MADDAPDPGPLRALSERLSKVRRRGGVPKDQPPTSPLGAAFRISTELVAAVAVGAGMGWLLDRWLGTSPLLLIVMFFLGVATGFRNVMRAAREMNEAAEKAREPRD